MPAEPTLRRLERRPEFLWVQHKGRRWITPGLVLQACPVRDARQNGGADGRIEIGIGLTASKKVGNAVQRNRARRRLRALAAGDLKRLAKPAVDYVLIARKGTLTRSWPDLRRDLYEALRRLKMLHRRVPGEDGEAA